ncbi:hypothetical protein SDC9_139982 [bioreactor metagenome]|uniref:Uncharacterized protein n=1 Tax=bioreactor metagenome TaxID=1076179 RepID=A0A645DU32_9ZZZZ
MYEDQLGQFAGVDAGRVALHSLGGGVDERFDGLDAGRRPLRGAADGVEHEQNPGFPGGIPADVQQEQVVVLLGFDDGFGQVEHRDVEQAPLDQIQQVQHPAGSAVAVDEGVDGLELVVADSHAHQGIDVFLVVQEFLPVGKQVAQSGCAFRWGVDGFACTVVGQTGTGCAPDIHGHALGRATNLDGRGGT